MQCEQNGLVDLAFPGILIAFAPKFMHYKVPDNREVHYQNMTFAADIYR